MRASALISAAAAIVIAAVVVVVLSLGGNDDSELATNATPAPTSTDPSPPPTAITPATEPLGSTTVPPGALEGLRAWELPQTEIPSQLDGERADGPATGAGSTDGTTAATAAPKPEPVSIPRPSCANNVGAASTRTAPFTGLSASIPASMPAVVVKVSNNDSRSRAALFGLDQADIVFEERIEASATRFFAVFHSSMPANVGPVRSGRTTDIQISQNLNRPVFGYSGSNEGVARQIRFAADNDLLVPYVNTDAAPFARDSRFSAPDNLFVDPGALGGCGGGGNPSAIFSYGPVPASAQAASSVSLSARSPYRFDWNGTAWARSQDGYAHTTRDGAALAPKNVVVLFVPYVPSQIDSASVDAETIGSGSAWVFRDGTATIGSWTRAKGHEPYTLTDGSGAAVTLSPGQTWVVLAPAGSASWN